MKRTKAVWMVLLLASCLACVTTPEQEYVTHKNTEEMLKKASQTPAGYSDSEQKDLREFYGIPFRFSDSESYCDGRFVLNVDADIEVPDARSLPIVRVEQGCFSQETVYRLYGYLCSGRPFVYKAESQLTQQQIASIIASLEERMQQETDESVIRQIEDQIASYKEQFQTAPQMVQEDPCDGTFRQMPVYSRTGKLICTYMGVDALTRDSDEFPAFFSVTNPDPNAIGIWVDGQMGLQEAVLSYDDIRFTGEDGETDSIYIKDIDDPAFADLSYRPAEAIDFVRRFWNEVGISDIQVDSVYWIKDAEQPSYKIVCSRTIQGVPCACLQSITTANNFARMWSYETISVFVDRDGIFSLSWMAPLAIKETLLENAALLPFDLIKDLFLQNMEFTYGAANAYSGGDRVSGTTLSKQITIDRITLSLQRINEQNHFDSALLVPVWNFYGTSITTGVESNLEFTETDRPRSPFLSINAIDGSVIDPSLGY